MRQIYYLVGQRFDDNRLVLHYYLQFTHKIDTDEEFYDSTINFLL